jgi:hypothetical protein
MQGKRYKRQYNDRDDEGEYTGYNDCLRGLVIFACLNGVQYKMKHLVEYIGHKYEGQ